MDKVIPSVRLKVVTVHKLWSMSCPRKYFWQWVLNLEPKKINLNYWYGSVWGEGFESLLLGKSLRQAYSAMDKESKRRTSRHTISDDDSYEIDLQMRLLKLFVKAVSTGPHPEFDMKKMKMKSRQVVVSFPLKTSGLTYYGTLEGLGTYCGKPVMFENKTAKSVNQVYFDRLAYDKQIHTYALARKKTRETCPKKCCYCILRKVQKRIKKNQSEDEFIQEIADDLKDQEKREWYFILHPVTLGVTTLKETEYDLEMGAARLKGFYNGLTEARLLNPHYWEKNDSQCSAWRGCEYQILCRYPARWNIYMKHFFQMRELMYEEERKELRE